MNRKILYWSGRERLDAVLQSRQTAFSSPHTTAGDILKGSTADSWERRSTSLAFLSFEQTRTATAGRLDFEQMGRLNTAERAERTGWKDGLLRCHCQNRQRYRINDRDRIAIIRREGGKRG